MNIPKRVESERALLGALLINPDHLIEVMDLLETRDFYEIASQQIWRAMLSLYNKGVEIDIVSLDNEIKKLETTGAVKASEISSYVVSDYRTKNIVTYAEEIKNASLLRDIVGMTSRFTDVAQNEEIEAGALLGEIETEVLTISERKKDARPIDTEGIIREIEKDQNTNWKGFKTKFSALDKRTGGFIPTQIWAMGAYTGTGKTFMTLQLMLNTLDQGAKVALFSTEMDRKLTMLRLMGNLAGLGTINILQGTLSETDKIELQKAKEKLTTYKDQLFIFDSVYTTEAIRLKCKKLKIQKGLDIVFIDFIQNLRGSENIYERMSAVAVELQQLAQELGITIIMVSQVNQASAGWKSKASIDFKGAGEIAAVSDVGVWINKNEDFKDIRDIHLRKVRHGAGGIFAVRVGFPSGRVIDLSDDSAKFIKQNTNEPTMEVGNEEKEDHDQLNF